MNEGFDKEFYRKGDSVKRQKSRQNQELRRAHGVLLEPPF